MLVYLHYILLVVVLTILVPYLYIGHVCLYHVLAVHLISIADWYIYVNSLDHPIEYWIYFDMHVQIVHSLQSAILYSP